VSKVVLNMLPEWRLLQYIDGLELASEDSSQYCCGLTDSMTYHELGDRLLVSQRSPILANVRVDTLKLWLSLEYNLR
jgi:hypothetical protein